MADEIVLVAYVVVVTGPVIVVVLGPAKKVSLLPP